MPPSRETFLAVAREAYAENPRQIIDSYILINSTPTVKFYVNNSTQELIIGVRGTKLSSHEDILADAAIAVGALQYTTRFKRDLSSVEHVKSQVPTFTIYAAGHSLGGAIIDLFIRLGLVKSAVTYNPAVQLFNQPSSNTRVYNRSDVLYNLGQPFLSSSPDVRTDKYEGYKYFGAIPGIAGSLMAHGTSALPVGGSQTGVSDDDNGESGNPMEYALSEDDIRKLCGDIPILRYPDMIGMETPDDLFKGHKAVALLFLTEGQNEGHWIAVLDHPDCYEVFDSFGTAIDGNRRWLSKAHLIEFNQTAPLLSTLLGKGSKPVIHNTVKLQNDHVDTCGRWIIARILNASTPLHQFVKEMKDDTGTPDQSVTRYIHSLLKK